MNWRLLFLLGLGTMVGFAQAPKAKPAWTAPRTAGGHPDLRGFWVNNIATPLERPAALAGRELLTDAETIAMKKKATELFGGSGDAAFFDGVYTAVLANVLGAKTGFVSTDGDTGDYSSVWTVEREWDNRTSLITDPKDGRQPALTPAGAERRAASFAGMRRPAEGPEDRLLQERCLTYGSPSLIAGYQSGYEIVQTPSTIALQTEMIHDTRVIPLDGGPHVPAAVKNWLGDSRGHWEGDTLVIDTTNYKVRSFMSMSSEQLRVTERLTRTGPNDLKYEITIDDPGTWVRPWSLMIPLKATTGPLYEYACHEGNVGLAGILAGARREEALSRPK